MDTVQTQLTPSPASPRLPQTSDGFLHMKHVQNSREEALSPQVHKAGERVTKYKSRLHP